jgi:hypothetical protein
MPLKELVLCLNRTLWGQFFREIYPRKKFTPKSGAVNSTITGILLTGFWLWRQYWRKFGDFFFKGPQRVLLTGFML